MTVTPTYLAQNLSELWLLTPGFDDLLLTGVNVDGNGNEFRMKAIDDSSASWGKASPIDVSVQRWMADGAIASTQGYENRDITFRLMVSAPTSLELTAGEAALAKRSGQPGLLKWISSQGDGVAPATIFELWTWRFGHELKTDDENRLARGYTVEATAKPWARSKDLTTSPAVTIPSSPTTVSVDTCASTTGWAGSPNAATVVGGTAVQEAKASTVKASYTVSLTRTGSVTGFGTTPYLTLDVSLLGASGPKLIVTVDSVVVTKVGQVGTVSYYAMPTGVTSFTTLKVTGSGTVPNGYNLTLQVADVSRTDTLGTLVGLRQLSRSLVPGGSMKTSGSIQVNSPSATVLGATMVYTCPDTGSGYTPALRQFRTTGNTVTADANAVSTFHEALISGGAGAGVITYVIPAQYLREATYLIVGRFFSTTNTTVFLEMSAHTTGQTSLDSCASYATLSSSGGTWAVIGTLSLPTQQLPDQSLVTQVLSFDGTGGTGVQTLDELYFLDITNGALSLIKTGTATYLWLDAPDVDAIRNRPAVYLGTASDRSDAVGAPYDSVLSLGDHDLYPDGTSLFTVTSGVDNAVVNGSFYRRWHTHAGS